MSSRWIGLPRIGSPIHRLGGFALAIGLSVCVAGGCRSHGTKPVFGPPGPIEQQRAKAVMHDPYPMTDIGPTLLDGRPRDYYRPVPEPVRSRMYSDALRAGMIQ
jgi:hypothetical protein